ncbi:MAG: AAA family ATPase, partial [Lachnospiraceae bacterium]|nr:AAA family ATPase [Lachnospiraceae bacterium]
MKKFNDRGPCFRQVHYMADISDKIEEITELVDGGDYFVISKPRQYGKTTTLCVLAQTLKDRYDCLDISFETSLEEDFDSSANFFAYIKRKFVDNLKELAETEAAKCLEGTELLKLLDLSDAISAFINRCSKPVVLMVDEVDAGTDHKIFIKFLSLLRDKFINRGKKGEITFQSVILAGLRDVTKLKPEIKKESAIPPDDEHVSPWNIATQFKVDMSLGY